MVEKAKSNVVCEGVISNYREAELLICSYSLLVTNSIENFFGAFPYIALRPLNPPVSIDLKLTGIFL